MPPRPILLAGPTASGKSALALALAERLGGMVVNADSQQVYAPWRILTARPSEAEMARAPHRLYGHLPLDAVYSVGAWLDDLAGVLGEAQSAGLRPIVVGGTGLYFRALTQGLAPIPRPTPEIRAAAEAALERLGPEGFARDLAARDPETAAQIDLANPARVMRAWEVLEQTGRPLAAWQDETAPPLLPLSATVPLVLAPERQTLYARCDARLGAMVEAGVLDEVAAVRDLGVPASAPGMKAVGAPEFLAHLAGETSLEEALERARTATRRYAKRQLTWIRSQMAEWHQIETPEPEHVVEMVRRCDAESPEG